jgi:TPR repeat protein
MLVDGIGIPADASRGVYWLEQAVSNEYYLAAKMLGSMYLSGLGVPMDPQKGAKYIILFEKQVPKEEVDSGCD